MELVLSCIRCGGFLLLVGPVGCESGRSNKYTGNKYWGPIFGGIIKNRANMKERRLFLA